MSLSGFFFFFGFFLPYLFVSCSLCSIVRSRPIVLRAVDFSIMKNPMASVGSEPAILGSRGQHANTQTPEAARIRTPNPSTPAVADLHPRPRGHRDRLSAEHGKKYLYCGHNAADV
jgi:hypothetical protein